MGSRGTVNLPENPKNNSPKGGGVPEASREPRPCWECQKGSDQIVNVDELHGGEEACWEQAARLASNTVRQRQQHALTVTAKREERAKWLLMSKKKLLGTLSK